MDTPRILVVDDEKTITDLVGIYLRNEGYDVTLAYTGADAARLILEQEFDLAVLDIMLPDVDGFELLRTIRTERTYPVIMLTARDSQADKIEGLSLGADDYMVKPFRPLELVARCKAQLRRYTSYGTREQSVAAEDAGPIIAFNGLSINKDARTVTVDEKPVRCTPLGVLDFAVFGRASWVRGTRGRAVPRRVGRGVHGGIQQHRDAPNPLTTKKKKHPPFPHPTDPPPFSKNHPLPLPESPCAHRHLREKLGDDVQNPRFIKNIWGCVTCRRPAAGATARGGGPAWRAGARACRGRARPSGRARPRGRPTSRPRSRACGTR